MKAGILFLVLGYSLSQFYRSFLAVLTPVLGTDIGATSSDLSFASGMWFVVFAAMQIPVGWALDKLGPRITVVSLLALGGGLGGAIFAMANSPIWVVVAMALFGVAGAPVLMSAYYIFARVFPQAIFATLAGAMIGFGSVGNLAGSAPLAYSVNAFGWRETMWGLALAACVVALALFVFLKDPPKDAAESDQKGNLISLLKNRNLLLLFPLMFVSYAPVAGIRGLWAGPYLEDVYGMDQTGIGRATFLMALAMIAGSFAYGPAERLIGSKKRIIMGGNLIVAGLCMALWLWPQTNPLAAAVWFMAIGFFGASFPAMMAHGQMFLPRHLIGRGITLINLFGIGGVGALQFLTSGMARNAGPVASSTPEFYAGLFLIFGLGLLIGCAVYVFCDELKNQRAD